MSSSQFSDSNIPKRRFWKEYKFFLKSLRETAYIESIFMDGIERDVDDYIKTGNLMFLEIVKLTSQHSLEIPLSEIYVMKLRFCLFYKEILCNHPKIHSHHLRNVKMQLEKYYKCYLRDLEELRGKELFESFCSEFAKKYDQVPKGVEEEINHVNLGNILMIRYKNEEEDEGEEEEEEGEGLTVGRITVEVVKESPNLKSPLLSTIIPPDIFSQANSAKLCKGLKKVIVSEQMIHCFLTVAQPHIEKKIEFCGMLCGLEEFVGGGETIFRVTHCIVPDQAGENGYVETYDEYRWCTFQTTGKIFKREEEEEEDYIESANIPLNGWKCLTTLGWIHTHPTQSAYLSSRDIYTHFPIQNSLDEAIAIVCSPRKKRNYGVYRIKSKKMETVRKLVNSSNGFGKRSIAFKLQGKLYEDCKHCEIKNDFEAEVADIRWDKRVRVLKK